MFDELSKEIKAHLYDKAKGPLTTTFVASWFVVNFKSFVILFSTASLSDKLLAFGLLHPTTEDVVLSTVILPIIYTAIIVLIYPHPARWAYEYWAKQHVKIKEIQREIEDTTPMTQEEANAIRRTALEQEFIFQNRINEISNSKKVAENQVEFLNNEIIKLKDEIIKTKNPKYYSSDDFLSLPEKDQKEIFNILLEKFSQVTSTSKPKEKKSISAIINEKSIYFIANDERFELNETVKNNFTIDTNIQDLTEIALFGLLVIFQGSSNEEYLINALKTNRIVTERALNNLRRSGLIVSLGNEVKITPQGRELAISTGMVKTLTGIGN